MKNNMKRRIPLSQANLPADLGSALHGVAAVAMLNDLSHSQVADALFVARYEMSKASGWPDERIAASMGMTLRALQIRKKKARTSDINALITNKAQSRGGRDAIALIIDITKGQPKNATQISDKLGFEYQDTLVLIRHAVQTKHLKVYSAGTPATEKYVATDLPYIYAAPLTSSERQSRAERSLRVIEQANPASIFQRTVDLTKAGEAHMRKLLDPHYRPAPQLDALVQGEKRAARRDTVKSRFAITLNLTIGKPDIGENARDFLFRRTFAYIDSATDMITTGGQFDDEARASFIDTDATNLGSHFEQQLDVASSLGSPNDPRQSFTFSLAYGPTPESSAPASPLDNNPAPTRKASPKIVGVALVILMTLLSIISAKKISAEKVFGNGHPTMLALVDHG